MIKNTTNKIRIKKVHSLSVGMTLIEVIIFTVLLSLLITNMINYLYTIHLNNIKLMNEIQDAQNIRQVRQAHLKQAQFKEGFIATTAIILLAMGTMAFLLATLSAASFYADSVQAREMRIQKQLNEQACQETLPIVVAKDYFLQGEVALSEFDCVIHR